MKILGVSSTRSDFDLLSGLYLRLAQEPEVEFGLIAGGAHLSPTFGSTIENVVADGLRVTARVESLLDSDSPAGRVKSAAIFLQGLVDVLAFQRPDAVLFAGDREDALAVATACTYLGLPAVHFFGGDHACDGHVDNPVRHAISKMATYHMVAHEEHRRRLLRIGEPAERIAVIGSPAVDKFTAEPSMPPEEVFGGLDPVGLASPEGYAVVIHHPIAEREEIAAEEAAAIFRVLGRKGIPAYVSVPNPDPGSRGLLRFYAEMQGTPGLVFYQSLPRGRFVNLLRGARLLLGNSSLGLLEAPSIPLPAVNVGERQRGRLAGENVIFVDGVDAEIDAAVDLATSADFMERLRYSRNPYGDGQSVGRAVALLRQLDLPSLRLKREDPLHLTNIE